MKTNIFIASVIAALMTAPAVLAQDTQASASDAVQPGDQALYCLALYDYFAAKSGEAPTDWMVRARRHAVEDYVTATGATAEQADRNAQIVRSADGFEIDEADMEWDAIDCDDIYSYDD